MVFHGPEKKVNRKVLLDSVVVEQQLKLHKSRGTISNKNGKYFEY